ncbi:unnamed protein product [Amoebophrya sp. A120]|nr:unnamed protein product [Amoebophrya sp. A120]|eukprot:GSA120T00013614001.1
MEFLPLDSQSNGKFLTLTEKNQITCHTNCRQESQGTAFFPVSSSTSGPTSRGSFTIKCTNKPGRMRYFVGLADHLFNPAAGCADIAKNSLASLENLKAGLHKNTGGTSTKSNVCLQSSTPSFHTGSLVKVEWSSCSGAGKNDENNNQLDVRISVDTTGFSQSCKVVKKKGAELFGFVSLYNREAVFEIVEE